MPFVEPDRIDYLTLDDVYEVAERVNGTPDSVRDPGLLASALARPQASAFGQDAYPTFALKAAALLHSIATNRALVDGNKRTAVVSTLLFYAMNGVQLTATDDELFDLILAVADGTRRDVEKIAELLEVWQVNGRRRGSLTRSSH